MSRRRIGLGGFGRAEVDAAYLPVEVDTDFCLYDMTKDAEVVCCTLEDRDKEEEPTLLNWNMC